MIQKRGVVYFCIAVTMLIFAMLMFTWFDWRLGILPSFVFLLYIYGYFCKTDDRLYYDVYVHYDSNNYTGFMKVLAENEEDAKKIVREQMRFAVCPDAQFKIYFSNDET